MQFNIRSKKQIAVIVFVLFVLILSACGGDGKEDEPTPNDGLPSVTPRGGEPPTEQAGLPTPDLPITPTATQFQGFPTLAVAPTVPPRYPESVQIVSPVTGSQLQGNVTIFGSASSSNFVQYALEYGPDPNPSNLWYPITLQAVTVPVLNNALGAWNTTLVPDGTYQMRLHVYLQNGQELTNAVITGLQVRNQQAPTAVAETNTPPVISPIAPLNLQRGQSVTIALGIFDADSDALSFLASSDNTTIASAVPSGQALTVTAIGAGIATVRVQVTDNRGGNAETSFLVTVTAPVDTNNPPNIVPIPSQVLTEGSTISVPLSISDPDGDTIDFTVRSTAPNIVQASKPPSGTSLTLQGLQAGSTTVTITATDVGGRTSTAVFSVVVDRRTPTNNLPVITTIPSQSIEVGEIRTIPLSISDPDGDPVTFTVQSSSTGVLTVIILDSNTIQIRGVSAGQASVTIIVRDNRGGSTSTLFTVVVTQPPPTNENPTIEAIPNQTIEIGQTLDIDLVMNDADSNPLTFSTTSANSAIVSTGPVDSDTLRILGVAEGSTSVTVNVGDGRGGSATTAFNVTVNPAAVPNQDPSIDPIDNQSIEVGQSALVSIAYSDPDDDPLAVTAISSAPEVATVFQSSATELAISGNMAGTAMITVSVDDGRSGTASTTFEVTVTTTNQPPNIAPIPSQSCESIDVISLVLSYNDPDGDEVAISVVSENELIAIPILLDDQVTLEITCDTVGEARITVTADDQRGGTTSSTFIVRVNEANQEPVLNDISSIEVEVGDITSVAISYSDSDGDSLTISAISSDSEIATVIVSLPNELSVNAIAAGLVTITVSVDDGRGGTASKTFTVTVGTPNLPPTIDPIADIELEVGDSVLVAINYSDPDGDPVTVTPSSNDETIATVEIASGTELTVNAVNGGVATITVIVEDNQGNSNSADFLVTVNAANVPPTISPIASVNIESGQSVPVGINYNDPDGDLVTVTPTSSDESIATVALTSDTELSVTGVSAGDATITVTVEDDQGNSNGTNFLVTVNLPNQAPTIAPIAPINIEAGQSVPVTISYSDPDGDSVTVIPASSDATIATVILSNDTELSVTGVAVGDTTITVTVEDDQGNSNSADFLVSVGAPNQAPTIDPIAPINIEVGQSVPVAINYSDPDGDPITVTPTSSDEGIATVILSSDTELTVTGVGVGDTIITVTVEDDQGNSNNTDFLVSVNVANQAPTIDPIAPINIEAGQSVPVAINYNDPDGNPVTVTTTSSNEGIASVILSSDTELTITGIAVGDTTITVVVEDDQGNSNSTDFLVSVGAPNQAPTIDPIAPINIEVGQSVPVAINYSDPDGDLVTVTPTSSDEAVTTVVLANDSELSVTGIVVGQSTITVTIEDDQGNSNSVEFLVTVFAPNQVPIIDPIAPVTVEAGQSVSVTISYADSDGDLVMPFVGSDDENVATAFLANDTEITITGVNAGTATITVTVDDGNGGTNSAAFTVAVESPNQTPAIDDLAPLSLTSGESVPVALNYNDPDGDPVSVSPASDDESVATVGLTGDFEITVTGVNAGIATITVAVDDGNGGTDSTTFTVSVEAPNQAPTIDPIAPSTIEVGQALLIAINYTDLDGDVVTVTPTSDNEGVATVFLSNTFELTVTGVSAGIVNITVNVDDGNGGMNSTSFTVTVESPNQAPIIDPVAPATIDIGQSVPVAINYSDPDGDTVTVTPSSDDEGVVSVFLSNTFELTITGVGAGTASITVNVDDGNGGSNSTAFDVTVSAPNQPPTIDPIAPVTVDLGQSLPIAINYSDPDGDTVTVTPISDNEAVVSAFLSDTFELTIVGVGVGTANVTATVDDGNGGTNSTAFAVTVAAPNQAPSIDPIAPVTVDLGQSLPIAIAYSDPEGNIVTVTPTSENEAIVSVFMSNTFELTVTGVGVGSATITVTVDDGNGGINSTAFVVNVTSPNQAPTIDPIAPVDITVGQSLPVAINYSDPNGDPVTVTPISDNEGIASVFMSNTSELTVTGIGVGSATITVNVDDGRGGTNAIAFAVNVSSPNQAPSIDPIAPVNVTVGQSLPVAINYSDLDGDPISVTPTSDNEGIATVFLNNTFELIVTGVADGVATITVTVDDARGGINSTAFTVTVSTANQNPTIDPVAPQSCQPGDAPNIAINFSDPDGDVLSVTSVSDNLAVADAIVADNTLTVNCLGEGTATITLTVDDGRGGLASTQFTVQVAAIVVPPSFDVSVYPELPDIDALSSQLLPVYSDGVNNLGRVNTAFSIAGDESLSALNFLDPIALGQYNLGNNPQLQDSIDHYNFTFQSVAVGSEWTIGALLDPSLADPGSCQVGETPLNCELRLTSPVVLFISFSPTHATSTPIDTFGTVLEQVVDITLDAGTIPVLVTLPDDGTVDPSILSDYNQVIVNAATQHSLHPDLDVPLWNLYNTMQGATSGIYAASPSGPADFSDPSLVYGDNRRGLAALQILDRIRLTFFP